MPGFVPHVTCGANVAASNTTLRSNFAPSSVRNSSHRAASFVEFLARRDVPAPAQIIDVS